MARIARFVGLSRSDKVLLLHCAWVVVAVRIGLTFLSYRSVITLLGKRVPSFRQGHLEAQHVVWAVSKVAKLVPHATCLTQALAAQMLLSKAGHSSSLRIGVAADEKGRFSAHAWLLSEERVLLGGPPQRLARYTTLTDLTLPLA